MKTAFQISLLFVVLFFNLNSSTAQDQSITKKYKREAIIELSRLMNDFYVLPDVAKATEEHLMTQLKASHFKEFDNDEDFSIALTESVQSINKDKHMRIWKNQPYEAPENSPERKVEERLDQINSVKTWNYGYNGVKIMDGNVGYLDLRSFADLERGKKGIDACMELMANCDAIIVDLSKNGGGSPFMVQYLCSYFFSQKTHLNSLYYREGNRTEEFWTLDEVEGTKMPNVPLFVITSDRTFSAAEEFSYNMQTQKRATLVGQTSGGGANPGGSMRINDNLTVFIPTGMAINPITKTNWEGVGVIPEVKTTVDETLQKTHELAKEAAELSRMKLKETYTKQYMSLIDKLEKYKAGNSNKEILEALTECGQSKLLAEEEINMLGYEYLMEHKKPEIAQVIFEANTLLHPNSANAYDSYAESLMTKGDLESALKNYQKAVDLASKNEDRDLELFERNLETIKNKIKEGK